MQTEPPSKQKQQTLLTKVKYLLLKGLHSKATLLISNIFLYAIEITVVFAIAYATDFAIVQIIRIVFEKIIGKDSTIVAILAFVQVLSNFGTIISYLLVMVVLVFFSYQRSDNIQDVAEDRLVDLRSKVRLLSRDAGEAIRDLFILVCIFLIVLIIAIGILKFLQLFPNSDIFKEIFNVVAAFGIAFGYTFGYIKSIWRFAEDLFRKLFEITLWQHLRDFLITLWQHLRDFF